MDSNLKIGRNPQKQFNSKMGQIPKLGENQKMDQNSKNGLKSRRKDKNSKSRNGSKFKNGNKMLENIEFLDIKWYFTPVYKTGGIVCVF